MSKWERNPRAPEGRQNVAPVVRPGSRCTPGPSPVGATERKGSAPRLALSPPRGFIHGVCIETHGSRRGLHSAAPPGLNSRLLRDVRFLLPPGEVALHDAARELAAA